MNKQVKMLSYSALMCALIIVSTLWFKFSIPGTEILVTTQVFFILLCGQLLPVKYCLYTIGAYLFIGLMGVPVFSSVAGPAVIATPTFGYLIGFPFAAVAVSLTCRKLKQVKGGRFVASLMGVVVNYVVALLYILALQGLHLRVAMPIGAFLFAYCFAFLPLDIIKAILAALLARRLEKPLHLNELSQSSL